MTLKRKFWSFLTPLSISWCSHHWICVFMSKWNRNSMENPCMFRSLLRVCRLVLCESANLPIISSMIFHHSLFIMLWTFSAFSCVWPQEGQATWTLTVFSQSFPIFRWAKPLQESVFSPCHCHWSCFEHFLHFWCSFHECEGKLNTSELFLQISHYKSTIINVCWEVQQRFMVTKLTDVTQNIVILQQVVAKNVLLAAVGSVGVQELLPSALYVCMKCKCLSVANYV